MITRSQYDAAFERERAMRYPCVDDLESETGFAVDQDLLERTARVLACPVKASPPNWQHGRVIYSTLKSMLATRRTEGRVRCLDIGTAKGFSAICMRRALDDEPYSCPGDVFSVDVIDPLARVIRNTVAEVDGPRTLREIVDPFVQPMHVVFLCATGTNWLTMNRKRVHFAFVDGKHNYASVRTELQLLAQCQEHGDVVVCDDVQIPGVRRAVDELLDYDVRYLEALPTRQYAIARRL